MSLRWVAAVAMGAATALTALSAYAQRREGFAATQVFSIQLRAPAQFGAATVPARRYRLTLTPGGFALADPSTMVLIATLPVQETSSAKLVTPARVDVKENGSAVEIVLRHLDHVYRAAGKATVLKARQAPTVTLAAKQEQLLDGLGPSQASERDLVQQAMRRYARSLRHCAESAHRARWRTDDPRFVRCACPILEKWRLPRVEAPLRIHHRLAPGRAGLSFTVTPKGRVTECRVWIGKGPPADEAAQQPPATESQP